MDVDAYTQQLIALLPSGPAWQVEAGSVLRRMLEGIAEELARVDGRSRDLMNEADPRTTLETLTDWERVYALPDPCDGANPTIGQRRAGLVAKVIARGGQTKAYFIDVAIARGYVITITEFEQHTVAHPVNAPLYGEDWAFAFQVNAPLNSVGVFTVNTPVSEPLAWWGNLALECVINNLKPAHTKALFAYS